MKPWKLRIAPMLILILVLASAWAAPGAILEKGNQLINLVTPWENTGALPFTGLNIRTTNGDAVPFTGTDQVLVITRISWNFTAKDPNANYLGQFKIGNYFSMGGQFVNGYTSGTYNVGPGIPITNFGTTIYVCKVDDPQTPIEGTLSMRLVGYLAPNR
jgi:hypothetical protein